MRTADQKIAFTWNKLNNSSPSEVTYLFTNIRLFLEKNNLKDSLPTLNLYCNWLVHSELDRSSCVLINDLKKQVNKHFALGTDFNLAMAEVLSVAKLEDEMRKILSRCQVPQSNHNIDWHIFLTTLFVELIDRPLKCSKLKFEHLCTYPDDFYGVKLVEFESKICWELLAPSLDKIGSRIIGPLIIRAQ